MKLRSYLRAVVVLAVASMLAAFFVLVPRADVVFAGINPPGITLDVKNTLKRDMNTKSAQTIYFGGEFDYSWRVAGMDGEGALPKDGAITLIAADILEHQKWASSDSHPLEYESCGIKGWMVDMLVDELTNVERGAMVMHSGVNDDRMWLFSREEAEKIDVELRRTNGNPEDQDGMWWLRDTTYDDICRALVVKGDGSFDDTGYSVCYGDKGLGIRPGFHLDESKVLFLSKTDQDGKLSGVEGADALHIVYDNTSGSWELTLKDDAREGFDAKVSDIEPEEYRWVEVDYSGAVTGKDEYLSALIMEEDGKVTYYGRIKALKYDTDKSGRVKINLWRKLYDGDSLYVFNEHYNGGVKTDWSSELKEMPIENVPPDNVVLRSAAIKASPKTVKKGRKTTVKVTSNSRAKLKAAASNKKAKTAIKKKYVKIRNGKTAKITFTKKAPKGKYTFKVTSPAKGKFKKTVKNIIIKVK